MGSHHRICCGNHLCVDLDRDWCGWSLLDFAVGLVRLDGSHLRDALSHSDADCDCGPIGTRCTSPRKVRMGALKAPRQRNLVAWLAGATVLIGVFIVPSLLTWRNGNERRALSLSNIRRLALAVQLYAQDFDDHLMPPEQRLPNGICLNWNAHAAAYGAVERILDNPANPLASAAGRVIDPQSGCSVDTGYALNHRFYGTFSPGPFLLDNLELPAQTALIVEAGPMWSRS